MITSRLIESGPVAATLARATAGGFSAAQAATESSAAESQTRSAASKPRRGDDATRLAALAKKLGVTTAPLRAAFEATRPDAPGRGDRRGDLAADLAAALNVETAKVQELLDANRPTRSERRRPARGERPGHAALITALAEGLSLDEAAVKAAFDKLRAAREADHDARHAAMVAALAKELGLSAEKVEAAFEAHRPAKPRR